MTLPNALSLFRIIAVPGVLVWWDRGLHVPALGLLTAAMLTDFFDGRLARRLHQESMLGAILDPVADKVVVIGMYVFLFTRGVLPGWLAGMTLLRNGSQLMAIPVLSWWLKIPFGVRPKSWPKWATAASFLIALVGLASLGTPYRTTSPLVANVCFLFLLLSGWMEFTILVTFLPRFYQIVSRTHDTFE
jgi:phosphatidylglycerophosphate synthase